MTKQRKGEIAGSWHNTGFHGHFRSKSRSDFICEYRQLAKPQPPVRFSNWSKQPSSRHIFSNHDNKHSFLNDALYFEEGLGRRRIDNSTNRYRRNLLTWVPHRIDLEKGPPRSSVYKVDYRGVPSEPLKQQIVKRPKTSFDDDLSDTTSYRYAYGSDNPNKQFLSAMSNTELVTARKQKMSTGSGKESVAGCMSWYRPQSPKPIIQTSTSMSEPCLTQTAQASDA